MIYSYKYIDHPIQKFHEGINFFFEKMIELDLVAYDEKRHIPKWFKKSVNTSSKLLLGNFKSFVTAFHDLEDSEKINIKEVFEANQYIGELCRGNGLPKKYDTITNEAFRNALRTFYDMLWTRVSNKDNCVNAEVEKICGKIITHYQAFREDLQHTLKVCPFCGLNGMLPSRSLNREAYDHYLPKAQYPFIAVNFENLVPMCHDCNSLEKTTKDPLDNEGVRRVVYYPFDDLPENHFEPKVIKDTTYNAGECSSLLKSIDWHFNLFSSGIPDLRLESWDNIFNLKERFAAILNDYESNWFTSVLSAFHDKDSMKTFINFRTDYIGKIRSEVSTSERSIVRFAYVYFLLHEDGMEEDLELLNVA